MQHTASRSFSQASSAQRGSYAVVWTAFALLLLLAGFGIGWLLRPTPPGPNSPEVEFARAMATHHEQAVEMALIIRDRSADERLRVLALDIMLTQQAQIGQMHGWLATWGQPFAGLEPPMAGHGTMMGMVAEQQVEELRSLPTAEAETNFLRLMIQHHQGGVHMAQMVLEQTDRPAVERLATAIVQSQQNEIDYMTDLLTERGAAP